MRVPSKLASAFDAAFEAVIAEFTSQEGLMPESSSLQSTRFLARSVVPHIKKLSSLFNRHEGNQGSGLTHYWKESSNSKNLLLAYFLYFMPSNLFRVASVWAELASLGFTWGNRRFRAIEVGAGTAAGACGIAAAEKYAPLGLPREGSWALIDQDRAALELGQKWAERYFGYSGFEDWGTRMFHRKIDLKQGFLPRSAPRFDLWVMSYFLNEFSDTSEDIVGELVGTWKRHLEDEGVVILVEPALKLQSRKLLEVRKEILVQRERQNLKELQVLLPCLGHQACGALATPGDWCHEEVTWWRPPYFRVIDKMAQLDRKTLPFSYLVLIRSARSIKQILPALSAGGPRHRLVSPVHFEGQDMEFYLCGQDGKSKARYRNPEKVELERGDILAQTKTRDNGGYVRVEKARRVKS